MTEIRDEFLSEEDLDLRNLTQEKLGAVAVSFCAVVPGFRVSASALGTLLPAPRPLATAGDAVIPAICVSALAGIAVVPAICTA